MKKLRIAAWIGFALVAGAIFYLTTQTPEATISASHWATEHLPALSYRAEMARRQRAADRPDKWRIFISSSRWGSALPWAMLGCARFSPTVQALAAMAIAWFVRWRIRRTSCLFPGGSSTAGIWC